MSVTALTAALLASAPPTAPVAPPVAPILASEVVVDQQPPALQPASPVAVDAAEPASNAAVPAAPAAPAGPTAGGDIVVTARPRVPGDPLQQLNAKAFAVSEAVDQAVIGPVARTYRSVIPLPIRDGLRNFLNNLHEPIVALNYLLQLKPGKALETLGRFAVNSTIGGAGLFDVAKRYPVNLPRRRNGFGDTFGYYGIKPGPFLFLPGTGPTTLRDLIGGVLDGLVLPLSVGKPFNQVSYTLPTGIVRGLDRRVAADAEISKTRAESADPYASRRTLYLQRRQAEIDALHGRGPAASPPVTSPTVQPRPN